MNAEQKRSALRIDLKLIADMVEPSSRLLDVGCGDGSLLEYLSHEKGVDGRGIELSMDGVNACVSRGLSVIQGDADTDLFNYPDHAFDFVILAQTLQATRAPKEVLENLLRIGRRAIVSLPNFGYWRVRLSLALQGRMPHTKTLPHNWYDTPNIHFARSVISWIYAMSLRLSLKIAFRWMPWVGENTCGMDIFGQTLWASRVFFSSAGAI